MSLPDITIKDNALLQSHVKVGDHSVMVQNLDNRFHKLSGKNGNTLRVEPGVLAVIDLRKLFGSSNGCNDKSEFLLGLDTADDDYTTCTVSLIPESAYEKEKKKRLQNSNSGRGGPRIFAEKAVGQSSPYISPEKDGDNSFEKDCGAWGESDKDHDNENDCGNGSPRVTNGSVPITPRRHHLYKSPLAPSINSSDTRGPSPSNFSICSSSSFDVSSESDEDDEVPFHPSAGLAQSGYVKGAPRRLQHHKEQWKRGAASKKKRNICPWRSPLGR